MDRADAILNLVSTHDLQYGVAIGAVAVFVLLLLRRRSDPRQVALYLVGAFLAVAAMPLLEAGLTAIEEGIAGDYGVFRPFPTELVFRTALPGALAGILGLLFMARAWRDSPER